jgi:hypothetical protein
VTIELADFKKRCSTKGPNGELLSFLAGNETEKELRDLIFLVVQAFQNTQLCPACKTHSECPFRIMAGLSHTSLKNLVNTMPVADCVKLFELEWQCRTNCLKAGGSV